MQRRKLASREDGDPQPSSRRWLSLSSGAQRPSPSPSPACVGGVVPSGALSASDTIKREGSPSTGVPGALGASQGVKVLRSCCVLTRSDLCSHLPVHAHIHTRILVHTHTHTCAHAPTQLHTHMSS